MTLDQLETAFKEILSDKKKEGPVDLMKLCSDRWAKAIRELKSKSQSETAWTRQAFVARADLGRPDSLVNLAEIGNFRNVDTTPVKDSTPQP